MSDRSAGALTLGLVLLSALATCGKPPRLGPPGDVEGGAGRAAPDAGEPEVGTLPTPGLDPGTVVIHRLNNAEYENTIRDLLGVEAAARATFQPDEQGTFDNDAEAFTINDARYEQYYFSAQNIAEQVFASPALRARVLPCAPTTPEETACAEQSIRAFGLRAWRRPLADDEVARLVLVYVAEVAAGKAFAGAMQTVVTAMLSAVGFLYRVELDADPASLVPHAVGPYELASRLSYWLWSSMPDDELFALAATGELSQPSVLKTQLARLLADRRSDAFVESFAGQWLDVRDLIGHQVEPTAFREWDEALRAAMAREMGLYFSEFLRTDRPFDGFLNADVNFVNERLARHYGMDTTGLGETSVRVENAGDQRKGYLGLGGFLTATAYSYRTDPRQRSRRILHQLLCDPPPFPVDVNAHGVLPPEATRGTFRDQFQAIVAMSGCAACHRAFDPIGLGLEGFDAIGRFRTLDSQGNVIDTSGTLADGRTFADERELADLLATDPRFLPCASRMALTYALGRELTTSDGPHLDRLMDAWKQKSFALRALLEQIVLSDTFRFRRGEGMP